MKKLISFTVLASMAIAITSCNTSNKNKNVSNNNPIISETESNKIIKLPNSIVKYETLEEAIEACGFKFSIPDTIVGYENKQYSIINDETIQITYYNEKKLESINEEDLKNITFDSFNANQHILFIRKSTGTEDISGDYNDYSEINRIYINNLDVTTKGNNGKISVAIWTNNGYTFAITTNNPISTDLLLDIIINIK